MCVEKIPQRTAVQETESKAPRSELMDELNYCRKDSLIIKEKHINLFERFIVYGLAKIQRDLKYSIACAPEYSRNLLSAQPFYLQSKDHFLKAIINAL